MKRPPARPQARSVGKDHKSSRLAGGAAPVALHFRRTLRLICQIWIHLSETGRSASVCRRGRQGEFRRARNQGDVRAVGNPDRLLDYVKLGSADSFPT
jgi:hypothetical protein